MKFTNDLTASAADVGKEISGSMETVGGTINDVVGSGSDAASKSIGGVPLAQLAQAVGQPAAPGVVKSNASPIPGAQPLPTQDPTKAANLPGDAKTWTVGAVIGGGVIVVLIVLFSMSRGSGSAGDDTRGGGGVFKTGRDVRPRKAAGGVRDDGAGAAAAPRQRRN